MSLRLSLSPDGSGLAAESEHGLPIALPRDPARAGAMLFRLLKEQSKKKTVALATGLDGSEMAIVLANWEKEAEGGGFRPRAGTAEACRYPGISLEATARRYDRRGRVVSPASFDHLEPL